MSTSTFKRISSILGIVLVWPHVVKAMEIDDGLQWSIIEDGGVKWSISSQAFEHMTPELGDLSEDAFFVSSGAHVIGSCLISTPWLPAAGPAEVVILPTMALLWTGYLDPLNPRSVGLTNIVLDIRDDSGTVEHIFFGLGSDNLAPKPVYVDGSGRVIYLGHLHTAPADPSPVMLRHQVEGPVEVRVSHCVLNESTLMWVRSLTMLVLPQN